MRIRWIDGLKGIASLMIVLHHFILAFMPALYYGSTIQSNIFKSEGALADSPFMFVIGGHFLVSLFLMLSGLVLSLQVYRTNTIKELLVNILKRYIRLAIPVFIVSVIVYGMLRYGLFSNNALAEVTGSPWLSLYYQAPLSLKSVFETSFYTVWFIGNDSFSTAFWMLTHLFFGSLMTYFIVFIVRKFEKNLQLFIIFVIIVTSIYFKSYMVNFGFGILLAWFIKHSPQTSNKKMLSIALLVIGLIFAGFPQGVLPTNFYRFFILSEFNSSFSILIHSIGAFLIVFGILLFNPRTSLFDDKLSQYLGKISYSIYLVHIPILFSISSFLFLKLKPYGLIYPLNMLVTLLITLIVLIIVSDIFNRAVISNIDRQLKKLFNH